MKKITYIILVIILLIPTMITASANSENTTTIVYLAFDEIEELIIENNPTIQMNETSLELLVDSMNSLEDDEDDYEKDNQRDIDAINQQIANYQEQLSKLLLLVVPVDAEVAEVSLYNAVNASIAYIRKVYEENINSLNQSKSSLNNTSNTNEQNSKAQLISLQNSIIQIEKSNKQIVQNAQSLYITYNSLIWDYEETAALLDVKEYELELLKLKKRLGLVKKEDVEAMETQIEDLHTTLENILIQKEDILGEVNLLLGQNYDIELEIGTIPEINPNELSEIDPKSDQEKALEISYSRITELNNYVLKSNALETAEEDHGDDSNEYKEAEVDYEKAIISLSDKELEIKNTFDDSFDGLKDKEDKFSTDKEDLADKNADYELAKTKYNLGMINGLEKENARMQYYLQGLTIKRSQLDLFKSYIEYQWILRGMI